MNTLLLVNSIMFGFIGIMFSVLGSNAQSRIFGIFNLVLFAANMAVMLDFVKV